MDGKFPRNVRKNFFYFVGDLALEQFVQRECVVSITGDIRELSGYNSVLCVVGRPCFSREVVQMARCGPFQPYPFWDSERSSVPGLR